MLYPGVSEDAARSAIDPLECRHGKGARKIVFLWGIMRPNRDGWRRIWKLRKRE